jgi:hypothetical protein
MPILNIEPLSGIKILWKKPGQKEAQPIKRVVAYSAWSISILNCPTFDIGIINSGLIQVYMEKQNQLNRDDSGGEECPS